MKTIKIWTLACLLLAGTLSAQSQSNPVKAKPWICDNGYWVVEGNIKTPLQHKIRFYTDDHILIGEKEVAGTRLNVKRRKVKIQLKAMLETTMIAWQQQYKSEMVKKQ